MGLELLISLVGAVSLAAGKVPDARDSLDTFARDSQELSRREHLIDRLYNPEVQVAGKTLLFRSAVLDAGTIDEAAVPPEYEYVWTNTGDRPVTVLKVTTTCGCAVPSFDRHPVAPGDSASLKIKYHPKGHPGKFDRKIFVYTDLSGSVPAAVLSLKGYVRAAGVPVWLYRYQMGNLCMRRTSVKFNSDKKGVERIMCMNAGDVPLIIGADAGLLPPFLSLRCEPEVIPPGGEADIVVAFDPEAVPMRMLSVIPVVLTGMDLPPSQRTIRVEIIDETNIRR